MDTDQMISSFRKQLESKSDEYYLEVFNMRKETVVNPDAVWNLNDLRKRTDQHTPDKLAQEIELIHAEIWARTMALLTCLHNLITQVQRDNGNPHNDSRVQDFLMAINIICLQYGVYYKMGKDSKLSWFLVKDIGLRMHMMLGGVMPPSTSTYPYEVALSFSGEDREYVRNVANLLQKRGKRVFFDEFEKAKLWGKDLYQHLNDVYKKMSLLCVIFISESYAKKLWTSHELKSAQARAFAENREYILPVRFDETQLPGLNDTIAYINGKQVSPSELVELICQKLEIL